MSPHRILFSGYAKVHFVCFLPVYQVLRQDPEIEVFLSGGFKKTEGDRSTFAIEGFYDDFPVDRAKILDAATAKTQDFDVVVCAHLSDALFPRSARSTVQIFHGVSFKNLAVREKALRYDFLCLPGHYHAERYRKQGLVRPDTSFTLVTGFPKVDALICGGDETITLVNEFGLDPALPTLLLAPTGDKYNALETMGREVIDRIAAEKRFNLLVKPHDHPKRSTDWFSELSDLEGSHVRLIRDFDIAPHLRAADLLITDASSVALEYTLLDRPILFLDTPKLLERLKKRAPALDLDTYGRKLGTIVREPGEVVAAIGDALANPRRDAALRRQAAHHLFHRPGTAAERVADVIRYAAGAARALPEGAEIVAPE